MAVYKNNEFTQNYGFMFSRKINEIKQKIDKLGDVFNLGLCREELDQIIEEVKDLKNGKVTGEVDYQEYNGRLDKLLKIVDTEYAPYYDVLLLSNHLGKVVCTITEDNYYDILQELKLFIDKIYRLPEITDVDDSADRKKVYDEAAKIIYKALLYENAIEKKGVFLLINNCSALRDSLSELIREDIKKLPKNEVMSIEYDHYDEGLKYDYISEDMIHRIAMRTLKKRNTEYLDRKNTALTEYMNYRDEIRKEKQDLEKQERNMKEASKDIRIARLKLLRSTILLPTVLSLALGGLCCFFKKDVKVKETTYDYNGDDDKKIVGEDEYYEKYNNRAYGVAYEIVMKCYSPWEEKLEGGFSRVVTEYEYKSNEPVQNVVVENIISEAEKKEFVEEKEELEPNDSTVDSDVEIIEYYYDDSDTRINYAETIWGLFYGFICGWNFISLTGGSDRIDRRFQDLREQKQRIHGRVKIKGVKIELEKLGDKVVKLETLLREDTKKYGKTDEVIEPELLKLVKKQ